MPSVSRNRIANVEDWGPVDDRWEDIEGTRIQFLTFREDVDSAPLLRGLPEDRCNCPHWGYVFKGKLTFELADRVEVYEAGDAFHVAPSHLPRVEPGTEYLQFSPAEALQHVSDTMRRNMEAMQTA